MSVSVQAQLQVPVSESFLVSPSKTIQLKKEEKSYYFIKHNVEEIEYRIHKYIYNLGIVSVPKIYSYNKNTKIMKMQKIPNICIADMYGENPRNISHYLFNEIRKIIEILYINNIEYPDITGYNFIEYQNKIWIVDFGHARYKLKITNLFIEKFLNGLNRWNPSFR
jgi:tRNA A-37 threonylcarbamoyl transferase component Bud32